MKRWLSLLLAVMLLVTAAGCSSNAVKEGDYEKIDKKLTRYFAEGAYQEAGELMAANEWYTVKDEQLAQTILDGVEDSVAAQNRWLELIKKIDSGLSSQIEAKKNEILTDLGLAHLYGSYMSEDVQSAWSGCTEGSTGYDFNQAMTCLNEGRPLDAGKLLYEHMADEDVREKFELYFLYEYMADVEIPDAQNYLETTLCAACIAHIKPASSVSALSVPGDPYAPSIYLHREGYLNGHNYDINAFEQMVMPEKIRSLLPKQISAENGEKILVLDRVDICGKNETQLIIDGYLMRSLPEEYCAESLKEVGYILLLDYGYLKESIWYAGTVTVRVFDVQTGEEIYTSDMLEGMFPLNYFGESTNVIFDRYPDITLAVRDAVSNII